MFTTDITLHAETHTYRNRNGDQYLSVSKLLEKLKNKFDSEKISYFSAKKRLKEKEEELTEEMVLDMQQAILKEWSDKAKTATDHGTRIHLIMETYLKNNTILDKTLESMILGVSKYFDKYSSTSQEQILSLEEYRIAGTSDSVCFRTKGNRGVVDILDFKTNEEISFYSKYDNFLKDPVSHIEECSYSVYCLQLSFYALMVELTHKRKIGQLAIIHIPKDCPENHNMISIPYMKWECLAILEKYREEILMDVGEQKEILYEVQDFDN